MDYHLVVTEDEDGVFGLAEATETAQEKFVRYLVDARNREHDRMIEERTMNLPIRVAEDRYQVFDEVLGKFDEFWGGETV